MSSSQQILDDINLRYRNSFTTDQILVWFNEEQQELFDVLELDSSPYTFQTVADENFYPFPDQFDTSKIKTVTYQISENTDPEPSFVEVPFLRNDDRQYGITSPWYTIISDAMYLYIPDAVPDDRAVYIYTDSDPDQVTSANLSVAPNLPTKYQELLKLGVLKRIAMARKDSIMVSNYSAEYEQKIGDILWNRRLKEPEYPQPIDGNYHPSWQTSYGGWPFIWRN
jgi:hypothetical protein